MPKTKLPVEVALINEVKSCRTCKWFWGEEPPYGPYPAFDWTETYPEDIRNPPAQTERGWKPIPWSRGVSRGDQLVEPAVLRGCRKAPIMTIGINPNMTAYFPGTRGARWAYPSFANDATYAYYYRHATVFQESVPDAFIVDHRVPGTEIHAAADGELIYGEQGSSHRWMELTLRYGDGPVERLELSWKPGERVALTVDPPRSPSDDPVPFRAGDLLACKVRTPEGLDVAVEANGTGYYQRLIPVLEGFADRVGHATPQMGEDVCMHDMVACASPGWNREKFDLPTDAVARHCVDEHDYVLRQLIQSRPDVLIIVSTSSLAMFAKSLEAAGGSLDFEYQTRDTSGAPRMRDIYDMLRETTQRKHYLKLTRDGVSLSCRVLLTPHFSYASNFRPQARFSVDAWRSFGQDYPIDAQILIDAGKVQSTTFNNYVPLNIEGPEDPIRAHLGVNAWEIVMARFYDPNAMLVDAFVQSYEDGELGHIDGGERLRRSAGECRFCVNDAWQFPEGCAYAKA